MEQQGEDQEQLSPVLRSIHNHYNSFVKFINTTRYNVRVYWIDYQGEMVCYKVLGPREDIDINTFVTHPWIFVDEETKDMFPGNGAKVFLPQPWFAKYQNMRVSELPARIERVPVHITLPLYSLRDLCMREIKRRLSYDYQAFDLEIPSSLKAELFYLHPRKFEPMSIANYIVRSRLTSDRMAPLPSRLAGHDLPRSPSSDSSNP